MAQARQRERPADWTSDGELGKVLGDVGKVHGSGVIVRGSMRPKLKHIPTGIFTLDMASLGGFPEGAATLMYGKEHSGKSTIGYRALARAQRKYPDMVPVLIDLEGAYLPEWGAMHGIDNERLALVTPDGGEQALDIASELCSSQEVSALMVDSLAMLTPMKEMEKSYEDATVGESAKLIARFCRNLQTRILRERKRAHRPMIILINQWRYKIGVMFGDPRVLPGGDAQHYFASLKIEIKNKEQMAKSGEDKGNVTHNEHSFNIAKNKVGAAVRQGEFQMIRDPDHPLGQGFVDDAPAVVAWMRSIGEITGGGSSWRVQEIDQKFGRLQEIADHFYLNPEYYEDLKIRLITQYRISKGLSDDWYL